jgi:hypothetical protein
LWDVTEDVTEESAALVFKVEVEVFSLQAWNAITFFLLRTFRDNIGPILMDQAIPDE